MSTAGHRAEHRAGTDAERTNASHDPRYGARSRRARLSLARLLFERRALFDLTSERGNTTLERAAVGGLGLRTKKPLVCARGGRELAEPFVRASHVVEEHALGLQIVGLPKERDRLLEASSLVRCLALLEELERPRITRRLRLVGTGNTGGRGHGKRRQETEECGDAESGTHVR